MIVLNLLSPHKRQRLASLIRFMFIKEALEIVLLTAILLAIAYLLGWLVLTNFLSELAQSTTLVNRGYSAYNQEVVQLNALIKKVNLAGSAYSPALPLMLDIARTLPPDIKLSSVNLNRAGKSLIISGTAKTRAALLNYQTALKTLPWLDNFTLPTAQLFQPENIDFEIKADLKNIKLNG